MNKADFLAFIERYMQAFPNQKVNVHDLAKQIPQHTILEPHTQQLLKPDEVKVLYELAHEVLIVYEAVRDNQGVILNGVALINEGITVGGYMGLLRSEGCGGGTGQSIIEAARRFDAAKNEFYCVLRILIDVLGVYAARDSLDMGWAGAWHRGTPLVHTTLKAAELDTKGVADE